MESLLNEPDEKWEFVTDVEGCQMWRRKQVDDNPIHCAWCTGAFSRGLRVADCEMVFGRRCENRGDVSPPGPQDL